jgi:hypothetical protein
VSELRRQFPASADSHTGSTREASGRRHVASRFDRRSIACAFLRALPGHATRRALDCAARSRRRAAKAQRVARTREARFNPRDSPLSRLSGRRLPRRRHGSIAHVRSDPSHGPQHGNPRGLFQYAKNCLLVFAVCRRTLNRYSSVHRSDPIANQTPKRSSTMKRLQPRRAQPTLPHRRRATARLRIATCSSATNRSKRPKQTKSKVKTKGAVSGAFSSSGQRGGPTASAKRQTIHGTPKQHLGLMRKCVQRSPY